MTVCSIFALIFFGCSTDAIPTSVSGPEQNQLVSTISIDPSDAVLQPDDQSQLSAVVYSARGRQIAGRDIQWSTDDPSIIDIDANGNIIAVNEGTTTIHARHNNVSGSATVDVRGDVVEIIFDAVASIEEGEVRSLGASYRYSNGAIRPAERVRWTTDDVEVIQLDGDGEATGITQGTVQVYATARGKRTGQVIKVRKNAAASVEIEAPSTSVQVGDDIQLWATVVDGRGRTLYVPVTWSTSSAAIATVSSSGLVSAKSAGVVTVSAQVDQLSASVQLDVLAASGGGGGGGGDAATVPGTVQDLGAAGATYSSMTLAFTETDDGTGQPANYEIRYDVTGGEFDWSRAPKVTKGTCSNVTGSAVGNRVTCLVDGLLAETPYQFRVVAIRASGEDVVYGPLSNIASGTTDAPGVIVDVVPSAFSVDVQSTNQLTAKVTDTFGQPLDLSVNWSTTASSVAPVTSSGLVTGASPGNASIRATAGGVSGSSQATVVQSAEGGSGTGSTGGTGGTGGSGGSIPPSSGWSPQGTLICDESFTGYADWTAFQNQHTGCITNVGYLTGWGRNNVDVDQNGLMYRFRALPSTCGDQIVGQATVGLPNQAREVWVEFTNVWSSNYTNVNPNCGSPSPGYKHILAWVDPPQGCGQYRFQIVTNGDNQIESAVPGFPQCDSVAVNPGAPDASGVVQYPPKTVRAPSPNKLFDGQPHTFRWHFAILGNDQYRIYLEIDGQVTHDYVTSGRSDAGMTLRNLFLGSNRNLGATQDMSMWWRDVKIWAR